MRDWQGNKINDGDTIVIIRTKPFINHVSWGFIVPFGESDKSKWIEVKNEPIDTKDYWEECYEYKIHECDGMLFKHLHSSDGFTYIQTLESLKMFGWDVDNLIAIRGKSDKKELYYK